MRREKFSPECLRSAVEGAARKEQRFLLTHDAVIEAINAFLNGIINENEIAEWAEFFDANENIEIECGDELRKSIFEISSPEINGQLEHQRAIELMELLNNEKRRENLAPGVSR